MDFKDTYESRPVVRRNAKDTVFTDLFRDPKYLLQIYRCLHPEDTAVTEEQIQSVTLKGVMPIPCTTIWAFWWRTAWWCW